MIAVPYEAFEVVRAEADMGGRVWRLNVEQWSVDELLFIAREGFRALGIIDRNEAVGRELANQSYGGPFLMQQLCYDYAIGLGVEHTAEEPIQATEVDNTFFRRVAERLEPAVFSKLLRGPNVRGQTRNERTFALGDHEFKTDIYGAVLVALSEVSNSLAPLRYQEIVKYLEDVLDEPPRSNQVTNALGHMSEIAWEARGDSDPALAYKDDEVHILDPFLAFYLENGPWIVATQTSRAETS